MLARRDRPSGDCFSGAVACLVAGSLLGCNLLHPHQEEDGLIYGFAGNSSVFGVGDAGEGGRSGAGGAGSGRGGTAGTSVDGFVGASTFPEVSEPLMRRLTNYEYDNTVHDLLGTGLSPGVTFEPPVSWNGFDNSAATLRTTPRDYENFFAAAHAIVDDVFESSDLTARVLSCTPSAQDTVCIRSIIESLGTKVWRRPLEEAEIQSSLDLYQDALNLGETPERGVRHMLRGWLSSLQFLYRMEIDPEPDARSARALSGYELASRLSYLLWSSTPDDALLAQAASGTLTGTTDALVAETERLLGDPKSTAFVSHFGAQWLGMDRLLNHQVNSAFFPAWTETLRIAMLQEGYAFFDEFLRTDLPLNQIFTHDVNFVNAELSSHYGFTTAAGTDLLRVEQTTDVRRGFLGLGVFLSTTSRDRRTSPTDRGTAVLDLLCTKAPLEPSILLLPEETGNDPLIDPANTRALLNASIYAHPQCSECHHLFDPYGLAMENFDGVGAYRDTYSNGDSIDATAAFTDGSVLLGFSNMTEVLASDPRFVACATQKLFTFAQGRPPAASELPQLQAILGNALAAGGSLPALLQQLVVNDSFRFRHSAAVPLEIPAAEVRP